MLLYPYNTMVFFMIKKISTFLFQMVYYKEMNIY